MPVLEKYMAQVQALEQKLADRDSLFNELQMEYNKLMEFSKKEEFILLKKVQHLQLATRENQKLREEIRRLSEMREGVVLGTMGAVEGEEEVVMEVEARDDAVIQEGEKAYLEKEEQVRQEILEVDKNI
jgi:hypothetical protein